MLRAVQARVHPGIKPPGGSVWGHKQRKRVWWDQWVLSEVGGETVHAGRKGWGLPRRPTSEAVLPPMLGGLEAGSAALPLRV